MVKRKKKIVSYKGDQYTLFDLSAYEVKDLIGSHADLSNARSRKGTARRPIKSASLEEQRESISAIVERYPPATR